MWTHQAIECLLSELRKRKSLYDQHHGDYLNREKRKACLESICKALLDKEQLEVSVEEVKAKIQVLRSQLNKELRYMASSKKYKPKLWCFKKAEFLKPYCANRTYASYNSTSNGTITNGQQKRKTPKNSIDQNESMSTNTFDADAPSSSNILTSKPTDTNEIEGETNGMQSETNGMQNETNSDFDLDQQLYETIALTQHIVQNRITARQHKAQSFKHQQSSWEGELVKNQLDLITDETIRSDTMWEIQCVLRRGIEQDRVLPKRRRGRNRRSSLAISEASASGSCISLDSNDSLCKDQSTLPQEETNILD